MPTVLITGAGRGLGLEFARQYASDGWRVIASCRSPEKASALHDLVKAYPTLRLEALDIADDQSIASLAERLGDTPIDLLVNNAGISSGTGLPGHQFTTDKPDQTQVFGSIDSEGWAKVLRINTVAPIMVTQALQRNLSRGEEPKIVMISSRMGSIGRIYRPNAVAYRTSKAALNAAVKSISFSLQAEKITIACFHPGWVKTDMGGNDADLTPQESVSSMRRVISSLTPEKSGQFFNYDGQILPW